MQMNQQYMSHSHVDELILQINENVDKIFNWFWAKNKIYHNKNTFQTMSHCNHTVCINGIPLYQVGNNHQEHAFTLLGIFIHEFVNWKHHMKFLYTKIARSLFIIKQVKCFLPNEGIHTLNFH